MQLRLVLISEPRPDSTFEVTESGLHIGRDAGNDICLKDQRMSRRHCTVRLENERSISLTTGVRTALTSTDFCFDTNVLVHGDRIHAALPINGRRRL
jgi:pSer/pThr/pTyr-binding forkhead associated (FHA) protein